MPAPEELSKAPINNHGGYDLPWLTCIFAAILVISVSLLYAIRIICKRLRIHNKLNRGDTVHKPLNLQHRRPTSAVKSTANASSGHYLKKSPSPTNLHPPACGNASNGRNSPSPTGSINRSSSRESPTSEDTSGPSLAEESSSNTTKVLIESEVKGNGCNNGGKTEQLSNTNEVLNGNLGQLFFSMRYNKDTSTLTVSLLKCQNLPLKDSSNSSSDPYVKLQLLPDKQHKVKTRVLRKTRNPIYDEDFSFYSIELSQLQSITLHFIILTFDRYSRDEVIGQVFFPLNSIDICEQSTPITFQKDIQPRSLKMKTQGRGEILVSVCWQPAANRLTVVVLKARNLPKMDVTGLADPYVKIYLMYKGQRIAKKKTHVKKRTLNPVFNESFVFETPPGNDGLQFISLEFLLLDWDRVTKNEVIGRLEMGNCKCDEAAQHHWNEVCTSPRRQIADWHKLRE